MFDIQVVQGFFTQNPISSAAILILFLWIVYVQIHNHLHLDWGYARIRGLLESTDDLKQSTTANELYEAKFFAAMCAQAYRLAYVNDSKKSQAKRDLNQFLSDSSWKLLPPSEAVPKQPYGKARRARLDGELVYGIWFRKLKTGTVQIALVFRGTHTLGDWWSNLRWFTKYIPILNGWDQYDLTQTVAHYVANDLVGHHKDLQGNGEPEIIAAGHSLGGGLAHQAGYATKAIKRVYSFNGTSVTGFFSLSKNERYKEGMRIYRIGERGEILALLRNTMKILFPVVQINPKIVEATYNFGPAGVTAHSIDDMAIAMIDAG